MWSLLEPKLTWFSGLIFQTGLGMRLLPKYRMIHDFSGLPIIISHTPHVKWYYLIFSCWQCIQNPKLKLLIGKSHHNSAEFTVSKYLCLQFRAGRSGVKWGRGILFPLLHGLQLHGILVGAQGIGDDGRCLLLIDCHWNQNMPASVQVVGKENCGLQDQENCTLFQTC